MDYLYLGVAPNNKVEFMELSNSLLKILVCPVSGGKLIYDRHNRELISESAYLSYPIIDSIPILLAEKGRKISPAILKSIIARINEANMEGNQPNSLPKKVSEVA